MFEQGITSKLKLKVTELIFPEISLGVQPVLGTLKVCEELKVMFKGRFATTILSATYRCNVGTMLSLFETMSQQCCDAVLR